MSSKIEDNIHSLLQVLITNKHPFAKAAVRRLEDLTGKVSDELLLKDHGDLAKFLYTRIFNKQTEEEQRQALSACASDLFRKTERTYQSCINISIDNARDSLATYSRKVAPLIGRGPFIGAPNALSLKNRLNDATARAKQAPSHPIGREVILEQWDPYFKHYDDSIDGIADVVKSMQDWLRVWEDYNRDKKRLMWQKISPCMAAVAIVVAILGWVPSVRDAVAASIMSVFTNPVNLPSQPEAQTKEDNAVRQSSPTK